MLSFYMFSGTASIPKRQQVRTKSPAVFFLFSKTPLGVAMIKMGKGIFHVNNNF